MIIVGPMLVFLLLVAPGIRLLTLALRTRERPELWGGLYFLGASIGLSLRVLGSSLFLTQPELADKLNTIGHVSFAGGTMAMTLFTLHVFRRESAGAKLFAALTTFAIFATSAVTLIGGYASIENSYSMVATNFARLIPTLWAFTESLAYYGSMRRRHSLGLADPVVVNRFLLWSIWTGAVTLLPLASLALRTSAILTFGSEATSGGTNAHVLSIMLTAIRILFVVVAPIAALTLSLSFFPPAFYIARIRARATAAESS